MASNVQVKLLVSRSGADGAFAPGDIIPVSAAEAGRMVEAGQAELVRAAKTETATRKSTARENAAK